MALLGKWLVCTLQNGNFSGDNDDHPCELGDCIQFSDKIISFLFRHSSLTHWKLSFLHRQSPFQGSCLPVTCLRWKSSSIWCHSSRGCSCWSVFPNHEMQISLIWMNTPYCWLIWLVRGLLAYPWYYIGIYWVVIIMFADEVGNSAALSAKPSLQSLPFLSSHCPFCISATSIALPSY